jgi:hypothetical protein
VQENSTHGMQEDSQYEENSLGVKGVRFGHTSFKNGYSTIHTSDPNSTLGYNSTFNRTQNKTIELKFSEKTLKLQKESRSRLAELTVNRKDKSSIGVGFYENSLTTNKLGKYLRPKSRLIKMGDEETSPINIGLKSNGS